MEEVHFPCNKLPPCWNCPEQEATVKCLDVELEKHTFTYWNPFLTCLARDDSGMLYFNHNLIEPEWHRGYW